MELKFHWATKKLREELKDFFSSNYCKDLKKFKEASTSFLSLKENGYIFDGYKELNNFGVNELEHIISNEIIFQEQKTKNKGGVELANSKKRSCAPLVNKLEKEVSMLLPVDYDAMIDIAIMTGDIEWRNELLMKASGIDG